MRSLVAAVIALSLISFAGCKKNGGPSSIDDVGIDETINLPNLSGPVDVVRDEWGRPHVYAANPVDAARVIGWLHAEDRFVQMDLQRRFGSGTVAELAGAASPATAESDRRMRALGLARAAQMQYDALAPTSVERQALDAYAEGVNARLAAFTAAPAPEYVAFGYPWADRPAWTPVDSLVIGRLLAYSLCFDGDFEVGIASTLASLQSAFPTGLRSGFASDLLEFDPPVDVAIVNPTLPTAFSADPSPDVVMTAGVSPETLATAHAWMKAAVQDPFNILYDPAKGSNNWIVGPSKSATGHPILANDPHLGLDAPPVWYELHVNTKRAGGNMDVVGVSLPGVPLVIIGATGDLAWGVTNVGPDVTDVYVEHYVLGTDGLGNVTAQVMWDADGPAATETPTLHPVTVEDHVIEVRTGPATVTTTHELVFRLPHREGVIVPGTMVNGTALSFAWTGFSATTEMQTIFQLQTAASAADLQAAVDLWDVPPQNFVYVDSQGNFGYVANGWYPVRGDDDADLHTDPPFLPMPGYDGAHEWVGRVARNEVPQEANPARGWIGTANQDPIGTTFDGDPLNDSYYLGGFYDLGFRGYRIAKVLNDDSSVSVADMQALQGNVVSNLGERLLPFLLESMGANYPAEQALLEGWRDRGFEAASGVGDNVAATEVDDAAATSLFNVWLVAMTRRTFNDETAAAGIGMQDQSRGRLLIRMLEAPDTMSTYDAGSGESILWDDLTTGAVETRDQVFVAAMDEALAWLASASGFGSASPDDWRWGLIHRVTFDRLSGLSSLSIPDPSDPEFGGKGFPRHGDNHAVDVANGGMTDYNFNYGGGPSQRIVVDMTPGKMRVYNQIPGGVSGDPDSVHYDDQALELWSQNRYAETWYREKDVAGHADTRTVFEP